MNRLAVLVSGLTLMLVACNDPKDPQTWIKKLRDTNTKIVDDAVKELQKLGDPVALQPLCDLFKDFPRPNILKAIISFKDKRSIPTLIAALDFTEDQYHNATIAANALVELKATVAVDALGKVLERPMSIKSRANLAKLAAIKALADLGDKKAVPYLIKTLEKRPEEQDFLLNKEAATALGVLDDPRGVSVLIRGLFMASTIQGSSFPQARVALVRIGQPAIGPLIEAMQDKDEKLKEMGKALDFEEGVILGKVSRVLGDMMVAEAVEPLLEILAKAKVAEDDYTKGIDGVIEALGKIFDERAVDPMLKLMNNVNADYKLRMQVCNALTIMGTKKAIPDLLKMSEKGEMEGGFTNLKDAAAMAFSRIVGAEVEPGYEVFKKIKEKYTKDGLTGNLELVDEVFQRMDLAKECKDDAECYGKIVVDEKQTLVRREKAGIMIGILPEGRKALSYLNKALPVREPVLRLYFLQAARRIGKASDAELVKILDELSEKDSRRKISFLGADLASEDKVTLAVVKRKGG